VWKDWDSAFVPHENDPEWTRSPNLARGGQVA